MQNLKKIYDLNNKYILGSNNNYLKTLRNDLIKNFEINNQIIKNNESIRYIDPSVLKNISFKIEEDVSNYQNLKKENQDPSINVNGGLNYELINIDNNQIDFNTLKSNLDLLIRNSKNNNNSFNQDYIANLNSILLNSGFIIKIKKDNNIKLLLNHKNSNINNTLFTKNFFEIKKNSKLILIESFINNFSSNSNIINFFELENNSEVFHFVIQNNVSESKLQFTTYSNCQNNSKFHQMIFNCSETSGRNHHYVNLLGQNSEANLKGLFFAGKHQIIDNKTEINHLSDNCYSNQMYKGILTDNAKASYLSKTFVDKIAQKTDGYQLSKGILLSDSAFFHSKPELKIYADDVKCSHGSTIGPFDKDIIYYLRSRGLNENKAKSILIDSFCQDLLSDIKEDQYINNINNFINKWLLQHVV